MEANQPLLPAPDMATYTNLPTGFSGHLLPLLSEAIDGITLFQSFLSTLSREISVHHQVLPPRVFKIPRPPFPVRLLSST